MQAEGARVVVRPVRPRDYEALARVYTDTFEPTTAGRLRRFWAVPRKERTLVAVVDGVAAATVTYEVRRILVDGVPLRTGCIAGVATAWDYRRRGLATLLLREAHRRLRAQGVSNATLFTHLHLPAIRIYRRLGYTETSAWVRSLEIRAPLQWLQARFAYRSRSLPRTSVGREALARWRERVLLQTPQGSATVSYDGKRFRVRSGRRGRPTLVVRGDARAIAGGFWDRFAYDDAVRRGRVRVTGSPEARALWRRIVTMEWRE